MLTEWDFVKNSERADCLITRCKQYLCEQFNHEFDPLQYIAAIPQPRLSNSFSWSLWAIILLIRMIMTS